MPRRYRLTIATARRLLRDASVGAVGGRRRHQRVRPQGRRDRTVAVERRVRLLALLLRDPALVDHVLVDVEVDRAVRDVDRDLVAVLDERDQATAGRLRGDVADRETRGAAGEAAVGDQRTLLTQTETLDVRGRVEHLLHTRPTLRALVPDHDDVAGLDPLGEDAGDRVVLGFEDDRGPGERQAVVRDAGGLDDAAVRGNVARQDRQA